MPAEKRERDSPEVKTQVMFMKRTGPAIQYFNWTRSNTQR